MLHCDCLLLDARMPGMSGAEVQRQLIALGSRIPTVGITADDSCQPFLDTGTETAIYLRKPVPSDILIGAIQRLVGGR